MDPQASFDLAAHDAYDQVEQQFEADLDESLRPRGPELLYDLVGEFGLPPGARALDVGCGPGTHAVELAQRFAFAVRGIDPVARQLELAREELAAAAVVRPELRNRVSFAAGTAEELPAGDHSVDLVWCRDVLSLVTDLNRAYAEFRRVLRPGGRALIYQMFGTDRLEPREAEWVFHTMDVRSSADPRHTEAAIAAAGLRVEKCVTLGTEWGEYAEENGGKPGRKLLHAARFLREPDRYVSRYGKTNYDIRMIGKLSPRVYLLRAGD